MEAKRAYESGAHRYCMVMAGRGPSTFKTKKVAQLIRTIKEKYPIQVCLSAGIVDKEKAAILSEAGLDRLNHNLNASESKYASICSTHTFQDRVNTLEAAKSSGLEVCSGVIIGMGESIEDIFSLAQKLNQMNVESIPVNFYIPIKGTKLEPVAPHLQLTPEFCLRALSLFRFMNPKAEIRLAAGREFHLRSLQPMGLYPANSIFLDGYLNTKGSKIKETFTMIKDLGFDIESKQDLESILSKTSIESIDKSSLKTVKELRPTVTTS